MARIKRTRSNIFIDEAPENITKEEKTAFANKVEAVLPNGFSGSYADAERAIQMSQSSKSLEAVQGQTISSGAPPESPNQIMDSSQVLQAGMDPSQAMNMSREEQQQMLASQQPEQAGLPQTTLGGTLGGMIHEAGPTAVAGAAGLALGGLPGAGLGMASVAVTDLLTPAITNFMNERGMNELDSKESVAKILSAVGIEDADTKAEEFFKSGARGVKEAAQFIGAGLLAQVGTPIIGELTRLQQGGAALTAGKIKQLVGGFGSEIGAESGHEGAMALSEKVKFLSGPKTSAILDVAMTLGGAVVGDMSLSNTVDLVENVSKLIKTKNMSIPDAIQEVLTAGKAQGVDILTSDFDPTGNRAALDQQAVRERISGGTRELRSPAELQRENMIDRLADEYNVNRNTKVSEELDKVNADFWAKRDGEWSAASNKRDEVYAAMDEVGGEVSTPKTLELIDNMRARLVEGDNKKMQPLIEELTNWEGMLSNKSLSTLEDHREYIGQIFKDPNIITLKNKTTNKEKKEIYRMLREEMGEHIQANGTDGDFKKYEDAMAELSTLSDDLKKAGIPAIMNSRGSSITAIKNSLFNESPEEVKKIYQRLTPEGQANARSALITKMLEESKTLGKLSPNQFAMKLKDYGGQRGILFDAADNSHLESIQLLLERTAKDQANYLESTMIPGEGMPGFSRAIAGIVLKNPVLGIGGLLGAAASRGWVVRQLEKPAARDAILKYRSIPAAKRASTEGDEALKRLGEIIRGYANEQADQEEGLTSDAPAPVQDNIPQTNAPAVLTR